GQDDAEVDGGRAVEQPDRDGPSGQLGGLDLLVDVVRRPAAQRHGGHGGDGAEDDGVQQPGGEPLAERGGPGLGLAPGGGLERVVRRRLPRHDRRLVPAREPVHLLRPRRLSAARAAGQRPGGRQGRGGRRGGRGRGRGGGRRGARRRCGGRGPGGGGLRRHGRGGRLLRARRRQRGGRGRCRGGTAGGRVGRRAVRVGRGRERGPGVGAPGDPAVLPAAEARLAGAVGAPRGGGLGTAAVLGLGRGLRGGGRGRRDGGGGRRGRRGGG